MEINKQSQIAGDNSQQNMAQTQTINNYNGIQLTDVVPIVHGLVKSELEMYQQVAESKAQMRFEEFSKSLESEIENKVADKVERFAEPSMQFATREATLGYIKSGEPEEKDALIDMLIERIKTQEHTSRQLIIDEAIHVLPKLSSKCMAILTLMTYSNLKVVGSKYILESWLRKLQPVVDLACEANNIDLEYLVQAGCLSSILGFKRNIDWFQSNRENYPLLFCHIDNQDAIGQFMTKYGIVPTDNGLEFHGVRETETIMKLFSYFDFTTDEKVSPQFLTTDKYDEIGISLSPFEENDLKSLLGIRTPMSDQEIIDYYKRIDPKWEQIIILMNSKFAQYNLNVVGKYIGVRQLSKLFGTPVPLDLLV